MPSHSPGDRSGVHPAAGLAFHPEAARLFALRGAEILLYPTAIGWIAEDKAAFGTSQHLAWETPDVAGMED